MLAHRHVAGAEPGVGGEGFAAGLGAAQVLAQDVRTRHLDLAGDAVGDRLLALVDEAYADAGERHVPGAYRTFWICDPKRRMISAAPFRDRVVQHALVAVIEPLFERRFVHHSYACRVGKGTHRALRQFTQWARTSRYILKLDVHKFFASVDHEILKRQLRRVLKDGQVLRLCDEIIDGSNPRSRSSSTFRVTTCSRRQHAAAASRSAI